MKYYHCPASQTLGIKPCSQDIPITCRGAASLKPIRSVHFPNDILFQDYVRQGELERIGRFIRAQRVTLDTIYHSGESHASERLSYTSRNVSSQTLFSALTVSCFPLWAGMAAIHEAVLSGNLECVKLLVQYGADIHQRDEEGWTPLHMACSDGFPDIARWASRLSPL